jgi:hypothetical protein
VRSDEARVETCEVKRRFRSERRLLILEDHFATYYAEAIGPNGKYSAGESEEVYLQPGTGWDSYHVQAVDRLIDKLARDGWDALAKGEEWYSYRFRRRAK